jgi:AcrR family transcriptional regulator
MEQNANVIFLHLWSMNMPSTDFKPRPQVKQRIEEAAMKLIAVSDSNSLSFTDIAKAANCSLQTLYNYYGTIENLWIACGGRVLKVLSNRLVDHLQGLEDPKERCRKAFWLMLDFSERHERSVELFMSNVRFQTWMQDESFQQPEVGRIILDLIETGQNAGVLTTEIDKVAILDFIYGVLFRFIQVRQIRKEKVSNAARANVLFEMVWRAISKI